MQTQIQFRVAETSRLGEIRAAQALHKQNRSRGLATLNGIFRAGTPPDPMPNGRYRGELVALDIAPGLTPLTEMISGAWMPWKGKDFDRAYARGDNLFTRDSLPLAHAYWPLYRGYMIDGPNTYRAFTFRTYLGAGQADPDRTVLKIDYNLPENPRATIRRVLDELVQVDDCVYLGKAHMHWWWGKWQTVAYFILTK